MSVTSFLPASPPKLRDVDRVTDLLEREPWNIDPVDGRLPDDVVRLINEETAKYARPRLSCACRDRRIEGLGGGRVVVFHEAEGRVSIPPFPLETTVDALVKDAVGDSSEVEAFRRAVTVRVGQEVVVKGLGHPFCMRRLMAVQAWSLYELPLALGEVGQIAVGGGKTLTSILSPLALPKVRTALLFAKPDQRGHYRRAYLQAREHFRVSSIVFDDNDMKGSYIVPGTPVLRFIPYSRLSNTKSSTLLDSFDDVDLIVGDEIHLLSSIRSSRTIRFLRFMSKHPDTVFACWSGSMVNKSIRDAHHLYAHALGLKSPYPIKDGDADAWSEVMDPSPCPDTTSTTAQMLYDAFADGQSPSPVQALLGDTEAVRSGFRRRVERTLGVITTRGSAATCSLTLGLRKAPAIPKEVREALADVRQRWVRPDGEELAETIEMIRCVREVGMGYYGYWAFPQGEPTDLIDEWYLARKLYHKELRRKILIGETNLDSPKLCADAAIRAFLEPRYDGDLPVWPEQSWPPWARVKDLVQPSPRTGWVAVRPGTPVPVDHPSLYIVRDAAEWAKANRGIVWVQGVTFGRKIAELAGIKYHGGGPNAEADILAEDGSRSIVCSIKAHSEGRDGLQYKFSKQLVTEIPSSSKGWEQLIGRLARVGQPEDTVETEIYGHISEILDALRSAIRDAEFVQGVTGNRQMLLAMDFSDELADLI
jgi:hypothetical protein